MYRRGGASLQLNATNRRVCWLIGPSQDHIDGSMLATGVVSQDKKGSLALEDVAVLIPFFTGEVVSQLPGKGQHSFGDAEMRLNYAIATLCSVSKYFHGDVVFGVRIFEISPTSQLVNADADVMHVSLQVETHKP